VLTGHDNGLITINIAEADDVHREKQRSLQKEPYRTLLGHFRHEIGHYFWDQLIAFGPRLEDFRALFGDERADYQKALDRHYGEGPPARWEDSFISAYSTMHPWEDWAESWAHYLHMVDALETAGATGPRAAAEAPRRAANAAAARSPEPELPRFRRDDRGVAVAHLRAQQLEPRAGASRTAIRSCSPHPPFASSGSSTTPSTRTARPTPGPPPRREATPVPFPSPAARVLYTRVLPRSPPGVDSRSAQSHVMHYRYDRPVMLGPQIVRLRPAPHCRTRILAYSLKIEPAEHFINWQQDPQANYLARLVFPKPTRELRVEVDLTAEMAVVNPFDFFLEPYAQHFPFRYEAADERELGPFLLTGPATPLFTQYLAGIPRERRATIDFLVDVNRRVAGDVRYLIRMEHGVQPPEVTLEKRSGSCRDSAELWCSCCATWGSRPASSRAISSSSSPTRSRWTAPPGRAGISRTCTPGARCTCRAPDGSASIPPPACSPARGTSRSRARRSLPPRRRFRAVWMRARPRSSTR
jgi:hypothetical protein